MTHFIFSENPVQITISPEETLLLGNEIGKALKKKKPQPIALLGDLGSGKTTLAKGIIQGLTQIDPNNITSPTFQYASLFYDEMKSIRVAHCDLWRLSSEEEFLNLGLGDLFDGYYLIIEWPERIQTLIAQKRAQIMAIHAEWEEEETRKYTYLPEYRF
ncbi:MAG: tRNA (adenosine(37)-N6)-threonylcarbamoyltransferase complex ATPase subunit type 1 TsaE [Chlamydia sp.]